MARASGPPKREIEGGLGADPSTGPGEEDRLTKATSDPGREIEALRERISALSAAILRINASLDVNTVLQEVVDSARALTAARYGIITTIDEGGGVREFVTSGFTPGEQRRFVEWRDGHRLFAHLRDLPGPVRISDLPAYVRKLGFSAELIQSRTFQGTPIRHRGVHVAAGCRPTGRVRPGAAPAEDQGGLLQRHQPQGGLPDGRVRLPRLSFPAKVCGVARWVVRGLVPSGCQPDRAQGVSAPRATVGFATA